MDTVTHAIAGSMLSRAASERAGARAALLLGAVASVFPDLDFLFIADRLQYLREHRGWSHSWVYLPVFALGLALLARVIFRRARLVMLWAFAAIGIASHILFDWITSFGTMFFVPFSHKRYSLDWVFILDPFFTGIVLLALVGCAIWRSRAREIAAGGAAALALYILFCAALHSRALKVWRRLDQPPAGSTVAVLPQLLSPFRWFGLSERSGEVHTAFFDIGPFARGSADPRRPQKASELLSSLSDFYPPPERARIRVFRQPPESRFLAACRSMPDVQVYLAFARFPLATVVPETAGGAVIIWEDLRFLPWFTGPWARDKRGGFRRQPFVYRVRMDAAGHPIERAFITSLRPD